MVESGGSHRAHKLENSMLWGLLESTFVAVEASKFKPQWQKVRHTQEPQQARAVAQTELLKSKTQSFHGIVAPLTERTLMSINH